MAEAYVSEIRIWPLDWAPDGWVICDGRELTIQNHMALYALLSNSFGGDGHSTFRVPDLRGRLPLGVGPARTSAGWQVDVPLAGVGGSFGPQTTSATGQTKITLKPENIPPHTHTGTFNGTPSSGTFDTNISIAAEQAQIAAVAGGSFAQGPTGGTSSAAVFAKPDSTSPRIELKGGSGTYTSTPVGTVDIGTTGNAQPFDVGINVAQTIEISLPPYIGLNYIICTVGIYPNRP